MKQRKILRASLTLSVLCLSVAVAGCYRATVETGRPPSGQTVTNEWAHSFIIGLVPPSTVNTAAQCPAGVARVVTEHSILNVIAHIFTAGLYSPMTITVECAAAGAALQVNSPAQLVTLPAGAAPEDVARALKLAVKRSADLGQPVYVDFSAAE
jgi:hypothetical protein